MSGDILGCHLQLNYAIVGLSASSETLSSYGLPVSNFGCLKYHQTIHCRVSDIEFGGVQFRVATWGCSLTRGNRTPWHTSYRAKSSGRVGMGRMKIFECRDWRKPALTMRKIVIFYECSLDRMCRWDSDSSVGNIGCQQYTNSSQFYACLEAAAEPSLSAQPLWFWSSDGNTPCFSKLTICYFEGFFFNKMLLTAIQ